MFLCAQVTLTPELRRITVFKRGTPNPSITNTPTCGQVPPISDVGIKEKVKKPQKKDPKNITSETINKIKAKRKAPFKPEVILPSRASFTKTKVHRMNTEQNTLNLIKNLSLSPPPSINMVETTRRRSQADTKTGR